MNLELFKNACEDRVLEKEQMSNYTMEKKDQEFKEVFEYLQGLFKNEFFIADDKR